MHAGEGPRGRRAPHVHPPPPHILQRNLVIKIQLKKMGPLRFSHNTNYPTKTNLKMTVHLWFYFIHSKNLLNCFGTWTIFFFKQKYNFSENNLLIPFGSFSVPSSSSGATFFLDYWIKILYLTEILLVTDNESWLFKREN